MSRSRVLAFGAVAAVMAGVAVAVAAGFAIGSSGSSGVAAAAAVTKSVDVGAATMRVTRGPGSTVCYGGPAVSSCASQLADTQLSYATGHRDDGRVVLAGIAGPHVKAVIARLSQGGTVWPELHSGAFYTVLPEGFRLRAIIKVLAGGRRVTFRV